MFKIIDLVNLKAIFKGQIQESPTQHKIVTSVLKPMLIWLEFRDLFCKFKKVCF